MKILITTDNIGGVWTFSLNLAKELRKNGIDVILAILGNPLTQPQEKELSNVPYCFFSCKQEWMADPWEDIAKAGEWLLNVKQFVHPDIVHLNSYSYGSLTWNTPLVITFHSCVLTWWEAVKKEKLPEEWLTYKEMACRGILAADAVVSPSNAMNKAAGKFYNFFKKGKVIYNGGNSSQYYTNKKEGYIFSMARLWDDAKNIKLILKAAPEIRYPIYIAGNFTGIDLHQIPENVHFIGRIPPDEVTVWLSKATIYLLPVIYEPFGYTFLEAAFSSCLIVTGDIPSMKEIWKDTAVYVDTGDSHKLAATLNSLMGDKRYTKLLGEKARKRALTKFTVAKMASEYISIYQNLSKRKVNKNFNLKKNEYISILSFGYFRLEPWKRAFFKRIDKFSVCQKQQSSGTGTKKRLESSEPDNGAGSVRLL